MSPASNRELGTECTPMLRDLTSSSSDRTSRCDWSSIMSRVTSRSMQRETDSPMRAAKGQKRTSTHACNQQLCLRGHGQRLSHIAATIGGDNFGQNCRMRLIRSTREVALSGASRSASVSWALRCSSYIEHSLIIASDGVARNHAGKGTAGRLARQKDERSAPSINRGENYPVVA